MADSDLPTENVREIYPYPGGRKKSKVWDTFGFYKIKPGPATKENLDMSQAICRICKKSYVNKGKSQNVSHSLKHPKPSNQTKPLRNTPTPTVDFDWNIDFFSPYRLIAIQNPSSPPPSLPTTQNPWISTERLMMHWESLFFLKSKHSYGKFTSFQDVFN